MQDYAIEVKQVSLAFDPKAAPELNNINLTIPAGSIVSLVGPSGCGKSTLLRLISGVLTPTSGTIKVSGNDQPENQGWSNLSFVPQDALLLPWRTIIDNVQLPLELAKELPPKTQREKACQALKLVNLPSIEDKYPHQLSGGMRQRAALARALVGDARILLLDEPFASIDDITRNQLHLELLRIHQQTKLTILLVTHNIFEAVFLSDQIVVMGEKPGRILGEIPITLAKPRDLKIMAQPEFGSLVGKVQALLETGWSEHYDQ